MSCTLKYPSYHGVKKAFWTKSVEQDQPSDLCLNPEDRRVKCHSENKDTHILTLTHVTEADKHLYYCRFTTNQPDGKYTGVPGPQLDVTGRNDQINHKFQWSNERWLSERKYRDTRCFRQISQPHTIKPLLYSVKGMKDPTDDRITRMFGLFSIIILLVDLGMCSEKWTVSYSYNVKCALKGSTTVMSGSFSYPKHLTITKTFWTVNPAKGFSPDLSKDPQYKDRVKVILSNDQTVFLILSNVTYEDEKMFCLRILTDEEEEKYLGFPGINLKVTELTVQVPEEVLEGNSVTLSCKSTCNVAKVQQYTWYKDRVPLPESVSSKELFLKSVRSKDSGEYSCALREEKDQFSPAVTLNVTYPPRMVSASIGSSGDSMNLTCSSESNPPVHIYSWFKENQTSSVGSGQSFITQHNGNFFCVAENKYGSERSAAVSVIFPGGQNKVLHVTLGILTVCICICFVIALVRIIRRKNADSANCDKSHQENISGAGPTGEHPTSSGSNIDMYTIIAHHKPNRVQKDGDDGEVQYACVHLHKNKENNVEESQYGNVSHHDPPVSSRSNAEPVEDSSVIYSSIRTRENQ